ncbi:MAG TPA: hypothetical protein VJH97_05590 [Candidatus Nanoarchaeia archaeon]|nr:hypothetical protein [Candidatus Nanoarchaeia archaeon]
MSHANNKVQWCLRKAEKELQESKVHRGIVKTGVNKEKAKEHMEKAEHYLSATLYLKKGNFSDISASTIFYSIYHCLLSIAAKYGYESRNQECTFALMASLIEDKLINLDKGWLVKIAPLESTEEHTTVKMREQYQYGTSVSLSDDVYEEQLSLAKRIMAKTKEILEK